MDKIKIKDQKDMIATIKKANKVDADVMVSVNGKWWIYDEFDGFDANGLNAVDDKGYTDFIKYKDIAFASISEGIAGNQIGYGFLPQITEFFRKCPEATTKDVHAFARELGVEAHKLEAEIYKLTADLLGR